MTSKKSYNASTETIDTLRSICDDKKITEGDAIARALTLYYYCMQHVTGIQTRDGKVHPLKLI